MPVSASVIVRSSGNVDPVPVDVPPSSAMDAESTDSTSTGALSSSMRSSSVDTVKVCWISSTAKIRVPMPAVKSVCAAVSLAATEVA